jgi:hypothetical protein
MRYKRKCLDCDHTWWIPGPQGALTCGLCGSKAIITVDKSDQPKRPLITGKYPRQDGATYPLHD